MYANDKQSKKIGMLQNFTEKRFKEKNEFTKLYCTQNYENVQDGKEQLDFEFWMYGRYVINFILIKIFEFGPEQLDFQLKSQRPKRKV